MRISYNWLKDYVDIKLSPEKLAELLTMAGLCVDSIHEKGNDHVLEIEITSNRPDWMSYIGVAREVGAITGKRLKTPIGKPPKGQGARVKGQIYVKVEDKKLCPRYTARVIRNVKVGESPGWLKEKLEAVGLRSVNNVVDITNFCLLETGQPMHAFDLDKLAGQSIVVRRAQKGEKIRTIDGLERTLDNDMLIIADDKSPVAIAGIMGGLSAEVSARTKNILLEAAYFDPISVRRASRRLALSTDSSYRFERKVDIENIIHASGRAVGLILKLAGGDPEEFMDTGKSKQTLKKISLRLDRLNKIIGAEIPPSRVKSILVSLGLKIRFSSKNVLELKPPEFRHDLQSEIDTIEEVARIYGYENIPETIPPVLESGKRLPPDTAIDRNIRGVLVNLGLSEIITYSLLSKKTLIPITGSSDGNVISIKNPLSNEQEVMRPTLIAGMLNSIRWNINRKLKDLKLFELGKAYFKEADNSFTEKKHLAVGITGQLYDGWIGHPRAATLFDLKGIIETLFDQIGVKSFSVKETLSPPFLPGLCACIEVAGDAVGVMGQVDPNALHDFDIKESVYAFEIDCDRLIKYTSLEKKFREIPKFPSVVRDISLVVDKNIFNADIISLIREAAGDILKLIGLVDRYSGGQIPEGKIGLTYRLEYQDTGRTLQDSDVQAIHSRIINALENNLSAKLR